MDILILAGFFIGMLVIVGLLSKLEKMYGVNRKEAGKPLKKIERLAGWICGIGLILIIFLAIKGVMINYMVIVLVAGTLSLLQTLAEWKYVKNPQRSISSLMLTVAFLLSILGLIEVAEWVSVNL